MTQQPDDQKPARGKGGFGEFADKYRERWARNHPDADRPASPPETASDAAADDATGSAAPSPPDTTKP